MLYVFSCKSETKGRIVEYFDDKKKAKEFYNFYKCQEIVGDSGITEVQLVEFNDCQEL